MRGNIPERGKRRLFDIHSISTAWEILDELYENNTMVCQKLRNKLKFFKPSNIHPNAIIIELFIEVQYLVKRIEKLEGIGCLEADPIYFNAIYRSLPKTHQKFWDERKVVGDWT